MSRRTLCTRYQRSHAKSAAGNGHVLKRTCQNRVRCLALSNAYAARPEMTNAHSRSVAPVATESPHLHGDRHRLRAVNRPAKQAIR
jgi:hypothetical protein